MFFELSITINPKTGTKKIVSKTTKTNKVSKPRVSNREPENLSEELEGWENQSFTSDTNTSETGEEDKRSK